MTVGEFKAWLEGFSEAMGSSPNAKQWKRIQERLQEVCDSTCHHTHWWPIWYSFTGSPNSIDTTWHPNTSELNVAANNIGREEALMLS